MCCDIMIMTHTHTHKIEKHFPLSNLYELKADQIPTHATCIECLHIYHGKNIIYDMCENPIITLPFQFGRHIWLQY